MRASEVDLSDLSIETAEKAVGELARLLLTRGRVAILVLHPNGQQIATINPSVLRGDTTAVLLAQHLLQVWADDDVYAFLEELNK